MGLPAKDLGSKDLLELFSKKKSSWNRFTTHGLSPRSQVKMDDLNLMKRKGMSLI
jgi:hypothetical protein